MIAIFIFQILFESHRRREADINFVGHCPNLEGGKELTAQVPASVLEIAGYFDPGKAKSVIEAPIFAFPNICDCCQISEKALVHPAEST